MGLIKVVLLTESDTIVPTLATISKSCGKNLLNKVKTVVESLHYTFETVEFSKLAFQEDESLNKFLYADVVIMDVTNETSRPTLVYFKGNRESMDYTDDIVLIRTSGLEDNSAVQLLKTTCKIKHLITYRYDEQCDRFFDVTNASTHRIVSFGSSLRDHLRQSAATIEQGLADRYISLMEKRKNKNDDKEAQRRYLWNEICEAILHENNQKCATPKLIIQLMYAFRDLQDYESMITLIERCEQSEEIAKNIRENRLISYLTAFARSRRSQGDDQEKALQILEGICQANRHEHELSNDITCLIGRIYKDKYTSSKCQSPEMLENAIDWYRRGFADDPNVYAGINLLCLLALTVDDVNTNSETYSIILQLYALLGKQGRQLRDISDYWDVATYFELHTVQRDWPKACQAALHMYLLNPPVWYLKSTINNLKILHQAREIRRGQSESSKKLAPEIELYSFWMEFFCDAIDSNSPDGRELPSRVPILICDNYEKNDGLKYEIIFLEAYLQLNTEPSNEAATIIIRILERPALKGQQDLTKRIEIDSIRSIIDVKKDNRFIFFYAHENSETFSAVELQICFSSAERRSAFNEKLSRSRKPSTSPTVKEDFAERLIFIPDANGNRKLLGQGTYGKVYLAEDHVTHQKFAVKDIFPNRVRSPAEVLENEIQNLSMLHHKNIVKYYGSLIDTNKKPHVFQVIMEYIEGGCLAKMIAHLGKFSEESIQNYTRQILEGLQYLHDHHVLHRDIKSANILVNCYGEIKISDFGTSKRLAGLNLCREEGIGTTPYMAPDIISVSPMGYGPEVDIWSVGCTVIEMATGKRPFHNLSNNLAIQHRLANERQIPDIPQELSEDAKDFLSRCFEPKETRPSAKTLLNHPFLKKKIGLVREPSFQNGNDPTSNHKTTHVIAISRKVSHEGTEDPCYEPAPSGRHGISGDDLRQKLAAFFRHSDYRAALIGNWMQLIAEKCQTELLDEDKLLELLEKICEHLDDPSNFDRLKTALNDIFNLSEMDVESRIDLERSVYLFIKAANIVLTPAYRLIPHVLFALDNIIRLIAEYLVGCIRTDFVPSAHGVTPNVLPSRVRYNSSHSWANHAQLSTDETNNITQQHRSLIEKNRESMRRWMETESAIKLRLAHLLGQNAHADPSLPESQPPIVELKSSSNNHDQFIFDGIPEQTDGQNCDAPSPTRARGQKRSRTLIELEEQYDRLLQEIIENRNQHELKPYLAHGTQLTS